MCSTHEVRLEYHHHQYTRKKKGKMYKIHLKYDKYQNTFLIGKVKIHMAESIKVLLLYIILDSIEIGDYLQTDFKIKIY